jgi:pathogenesis-related protein 1
MPFLLIFTNVNSQEKNIIIDKDGKKIILHDNNTWDYYIEEEKPKESNNIETKLKSELNNLFNKLTGKKSNEKSPESSNETLTNNPKSTNKNKNNQSSEIQAFLKVHNDERKRLGIPPLEWDESIANGCLEYANYLLKINQLQHAETEYGENLFGGSSSVPNQYNLKDAALAWLSEKKSFKENKYTYQCGHYTQMIWRNTQKVGAAIVSENGKCYVVARYFPPGNYSNEKVY